jgi:peptide deformylase
LAILDIVTVPDPVLMKRADELRDFNPEIERIVMDMAETMYHAPGAGLAANQVGLLKQVAVLDVSPPDEEKNLIILINPKIVTMEGELIGEEGCLSVPDLRVEMKRAARVKVIARNLRGEDVEIDAEGLLARAIQHELDHLMGNTILDRIGRLKRRMYLNNLKKQSRAGL